MIPETRHALRRAWGLCERHAWADLAVEMCFRRTLLHGPALLYEDLLGRCIAALSRGGPFGTQRVVRRLRSHGPCLMCELNVYRAGRGGALQGTIERGRQTAPLWRFAVDHQEYWREAVCGICSGSNSQIRCRRHLVDQAGLGQDLVNSHVDMIAEVFGRVKLLARSYVWGNRGTDRPQDRAALISAAGFMSGWRPLLVLLTADTAEVVR